MTTPQERSAVPAPGAEPAYESVRLRLFNALPALIGQLLDAEERARVARRDAEILASAIQVISREATRRG